MSDLRAAHRDASWYRNPSSYGSEVKYHVLVDSLENHTQSAWQVAASSRSTRIRGWMRPSRLLQSNTQCGVCTPVFAFDGQQRRQSAHADSLSFGSVVVLMHLNIS